MKNHILLIPIISFCLMITSCTEKTFVAEDKSKEEPKDNKPEVVVTAPKVEIQKPPEVPLEDTNKSNAENIVFYTDKAVVLTYHHISTKPISSITIKPERFEADLIMLKEGGFNVISLKDMLAGIDGKAKFPPNAVVITFDDGYESFYKYGYPLLKKYSMHAVNFIITSWTENYKPTGGELNSLGPDEISEMYKSGLIDIESHSHNGHDYIIKDENGKTGGMLAFRIYDTNTGKYESEDSYNKRVIEDLSKSRPNIKKYTGEDPEVFCFPFGHYNSKLIELGKQAGFKYFVTTVYGNNKLNSKVILIKRIRSGDAKLTTQKLKQNIINCGRGLPVTQ